MYTPDSTPWLLFKIENLDSWDDENSLYVFTSLSKVSTDHNFTAMKSRFNTNKNACCGTWVQKTSRVPIKDRDGNVVEGRRMLIFQVNGIGDVFDDSKITFDVSKRSLFKLPTKKTTDRVSKNGNKAKKTKQNKKKKQSMKNLEESSSSISKSADGMNTSKVLEKIWGLNSESLDGGVGCVDWNATAPYDWS
ncbi:hypothetical protein POM88_050382 [Heracleum sosnowskyi]|uniref:Uncharacterized protein n=1 Tax=Heracleum sosnowskyi TaxID=360622 RepID=A0AAD8GYL9_9APIA|nr:hypothetical protein POM88_050382 [Heracleum sosnowskyi]